MPAVIIDELKRATAEVPARSAINHKRRDSMRRREFINTYAQSHPGVVFMRKDEIARFALSSPQTIREAI